MPASTRYAPGSFGEVSHPVAAAADTRLLSAEDFDDTGILVGVDPCASSYWWTPELHSVLERVDHHRQTMLQATQRTVSRPAATSRSTSAANAA
jgi:hypothetical protein